MITHKNDTAFDEDYRQWFHVATFYDEEKAKKAYKRLLPYATEASYSFSLNLLLAWSERLQCYHILVNKNHAGELFRFRQLAEMLDGQQLPYPKKRTFEAKELSCQNEQDEL